jgi:seryl-tRNA synthetase
MKSAVIVLSLTFVAACATAIFFAVSANAASARADTLEEQLFSAQQKAGQELNVKVAEVRVELEASNNQNQQLKSELAASGETIRQLSRTVEELTPFAKKAREMPVRLAERKATGGSLLLQIENLSNIALPLRGKLINPEINRTNSFEVTLDPARITASVKEVSPFENWSATAENLVELRSEGYDPVRRRFP